VLEIIVVIIFNQSVAI